MSKSWPLLILAGLMLFSAPLQAKVIQVKSTKKLQKVIDKAAPGDTLLLRAGVYEAQPTTVVDSLCGNCQNAITPHPMSYGFHITKPIVIRGEDFGKVVLKTNAGYGVFIDGAENVTLENLSITGGVRDTSGLATDGGVVVRNSRTVLQGVAIRGNNNRAEGVIVGIAGVVGREGANLRVEDCLILDNSWDGIALYRGSRAVIEGNIIQTGRGAGVGITWDAVAEVRANEISGYWKGIGSFGTTTAVVQDNLVRDLRGWGIVATGESVMDAAHNVIARTGNCGFAVWSEQSRGRFVDNIIYEAGRQKEWVCPEVGVWWNGPDDAFEAHHNVIWGSTAEGWRRSIWEDDPSGAATEPTQNIAVAPDSTWSGLYREIDPEFADPEANDFRLVETSPLAGAGFFAGHPGLSHPTDIGITAKSWERILASRERYGMESPLSPSGEKNGD
ncbi:MAG: right-handed parallel beta-helix repeat-containing protein [bacterium]